MSEPVTAKDIAAELRRRSSPMAKSAEGYACDGLPLPEWCNACLHELAASYLDEARDLQHELLDLITLMPDSQTAKIVHHIAELRRIRGRA